MNRRVRRVLTVLLSVSAVIAMSLTVASPASADEWDCRSYLSGVGYNVGPKVSAACAAAEQGIFGMAACQGALAALGVAQSHYTEACYRGYAW